MLKDCHKCRACSNGMCKSQIKYDHFIPSALYKYQQVEVTRTYFFKNKITIETPVSSGSMHAFCKKQGFANKRHLQDTLVGLACLFGWGDCLSYVTRYTLQCHMKQDGDWLPDACGKVGETIR